MNYISLLGRFMKGHATSEEIVLLKKWILSDEAQEELFTYYHQHWQEAADNTISREQQERMFANISGNIRKEKNRERLSGLKQIISRHWTSYAAIILLCLTVGFGTYFYTNKNSDVQPVAAKEYTVTAEKGQRASVTLPDGTRVWLNSHTTISYSNEYGIKDRIVFLTGEAYFEVSKNPDQRFIVKANEMEVEALGTSFNVKAYKEDNNITTTLFSGKVRATAGDKTTILAPEQFALYDRDNNRLLTNYAQNIEYASMWRNNELAFESITLGDIAVLLNRIYNVQVEFTSERIRNYRFSGVIKNNSLDNVIEIISLTAPIEYSSSGNMIVLSEKNSN